MKNKYRVLTVICIVISMLSIYLLNNKKSDYVNIVLDVNNDAILLESSGEFIQNLKAKLENTNKYKVYLSNNNDGNDFLDKRWSLIEDKDIDLVINFDNSYIFKEVSGVEIYSFPLNYSQNKNSLKFSNILKDILINNEVVVSGVYYPCLTPVKSEVYHFDKFLVEEEHVCDLTIDIFNKYTFDTVVISNNDFNKDGIVDLYFEAIENYFSL